MDKEILLELLGVGKEHTAEEYRQNFLKDDFSARRRHSDKDYEKGTISLEDQEQMGRVREIHGAAWNGLAREKGQKYDPAAYGKDSPLSVLRDNNGIYVAEILYDLAEQNPDAIEEILAGAFEHRPELFLEPGAADEFLNQRMSDLMDAMAFGEVAETVDSNLTHEDFSNRKQNYPKQDFNRKWNHTRTKTQVVLMSDVDEKYPTEDAFDIAEAKAVIGALPEEDRKILLLHIQGYTQEEIAKKLGYKTHSAVGKKLKKIKAQLKTTV